MKLIEDIIMAYPSKYAKENNIDNIWNEPLVAYAAATDPLFTDLKTIIDPTHMLPTDFIAEARTVIAFFIPFKENIATSNIDGSEPSLVWAQAYVDTNNMIAALKDYLCAELRTAGYKADPANVGWNQEQDGIKSRWSQRSAAFIAGLGRFGINNMLITEKGCCGRFGSIVTSLELEPSVRPSEEFCLFKRDASCSVCVKRCVGGAFTIDKSRASKTTSSQLIDGGAAEFGVFFDRHKCSDYIHKQLEFSEEYPTRDVCGKCDVGLPCSFRKPQ